MHDKYVESVNKMIAWAKKDNNIQGVIVLGSQVRKQFTGDEWSDLDFLLLVNNTSVLKNQKNWLDQFGQIVCNSIENVNIQFLKLAWHVDRVLYSDNKIIDFSILPNNRIDDVLLINKDIHSKGYKVIYDTNATILDSKIKETLIDAVYSVNIKISEIKLNTLVNDLIFHINLAYKKIKRNELWVAVAIINSKMNEMLLQLIEYHTVSVTKKTSILSYEGRFLENRTDSIILKKLQNCFTKYDKTDAIDTLGCLLGMVSFIVNDICEVNSSPVKQNQFLIARKLFEEMKAK
jgi:predicted nucleotidyltransferase